MDSSQEADPSAEQGAQNNPAEERTHSLGNADTRLQSISQEPAGQQQPGSPNTGTVVTAEDISERTREPPHDRQEHTTLTGELKDNLLQKDVPQTPSQSSQTEDGWCDLTKEGSENARYRSHPHSWTGECDLDNVICVKFYAALRKEVDTKHDKMYLVIYPKDRKFEMTQIRTDEAGSMFTCDLCLDKTHVNELYYTYCLADEYENLQDFKYRKLYRDISEDDKVFHQFDDICMGTSRWIMNKKTTVWEIRPEFLQAMLTQLMKCTNKDLSTMQTTAAFFRDCVEKRHGIDHQMLSREIKTSWDKVKEKLDKAFQHAVTELKNTSPVQYVLAAAVLAEFFHIKPGKGTIEKLSEIVKQNGMLDGTLASLEDPVRWVLSEAVRYVYNLACKMSPKEAHWFMALFYAVSPEGVDPLAYRNMSQTTAQRNLSEMVKTHCMVIKRCKAFRDAVLDMCDAGDGRHLLKLSITPDEFLSQLKKWQKPNRFHTLHQDVKIAASQIKDWLKESQERSTSETLKMDVDSCLQKTLNILQNSLKDTNWIEHWENVLSALQLLNAFTDYSDRHSDDMGLNRDDYRSTFSHLTKKMSDCITQHQKGNKIHWSEVFNLRLPNIWQKVWENILKTHFREHLQKKKITDMVKYYCSSSGVCSAMEDCMLTCVQDAINKQTIESNQKGCQSTWRELLNIIVKSNKPGTLSFIIESKLRGLEWSQKDFLYLLYDEQLKDVF
ncbi:hypothetical protein AMELA_G00242920, partial [Ameiurus melas]